MTTPLRPHELNDPRLETEAERVEAWRAHVLVVAGYPNELALAIASRPDIDLHHAVELVAERGCPALTAGQILL